MSPERSIAVALAAAALASAPLSAASQDSAQGRQKAQACSVCHGPLGISMVPDAPHLAGQPAIYLAAQLRLYRSGERKHEVMGVMARNLSNEDINHLAAWYASIRIEAKAPD